MKFTTTQPLPPPQKFSPEFTDQDDFEFIELTNTTSSPLDLTNLAFTAGIHIDFSTLSPSERIIPANGRILLARNPAALNQRYGASVNALASYSGSLDNGGETITLSLHSAAFLTLTYNDKFPWPESPDGNGPSLVLTSPNSNPDLQNSLNWQSSPSNNGSPLSTDIVSFVGNPTADDNQDGINNLLHFALTDSSSPLFLPSMGFEEANPTYTFQRNLTAQFNYTVEYSEDLITWTGLDQNALQVIIRNSNATALYSFQFSTPTLPHSQQFFRLRVTQP